MENQDYNEAIANADIAMDNDNPELGLKWYSKALEARPDDVYALSRSGAIYTANGDFEKAFDCFKKAMDADPDNGDSIYNMANAYFFQGDISRAMEMYSEAELKPCSDDVRSKIYYQLALCCTIKEDLKAALINYRKYQDSDTTGLAMTDPDVISEKIKIYMLLDQMDEAVKCALQWINVSPADLRCYMVYFNLLLAQGEFASAEAALADAEKYAEYDDEGKFSIDISRAQLYIAESGTDADVNSDCDAKAYDLIGELIVSPNGNDDQKNDLVMALAELCLKMGKTDEAIDTAKMLLGKAEGEITTAEVQPEQTAIPTEEEVLAQLDADTAAMDSAIADGRIDENIGDAAEVNYDENGQPVRNYPDGVFGDNGKTLTVNGLELDGGTPEEISRARIDKARFILLSCYAVKEDYKEVLNISKDVKNSENPYYAFFGRYSEAFSMMKLAPMS